MQMLQFVIVNHNPDYHPITHSCYYLQIVKWFWNLA